MHGSVPFLSSAREVTNYRPTCVHFNGCVACVPGLASSQSDFFLQNKWHRFYTCRMFLPPSQQCRKHWMSVTSSSNCHLWKDHRTLCWLSDACSHRQQDAVVYDGLCPRCRHLSNWTKRTCRLRFWPICSIMWKHDVINKTRTTQRIALPSEDSHRWNALKSWWNLNMWFWRCMSGHYNTSPSCRERSNCYHIGAAPYGFVNLYQMSVRHWLNCQPVSRSNLEIIDLTTQPVMVAKHSWKAKSSKLHWIA